MVLYLNLYVLILLLGKEANAYRQLLIHTEQ